MTSRIRATLVVALVVTGTAACSKQSEPTSTATQTVIVSEKTVTATPSSRPKKTSSAPAATTAQATPVGQSMPTTAAEYADAFVRAWGIGDRPAADRYATSDTVASLFAGWPRGGSTWKRTRSDIQDSRTQVTYLNADRTTLYVIVDTSTVARGGEDAIVSTTIDYEVAATPEPQTTYDDGYDDPYSVTGLPSTVPTYADAFVRAWGVGDTTSLQYVRDWSTLGLDGTGGPNWARTGSTSTTATYRDSKAGSTMVITLDASRVSAGRGGAITAISIS